MKAKIQLLFKFLFFLLLSSTSLFGDSNFNMLSGEYSLELKATDSNENYPINMTFITNDEGVITNASILYPTYGCKAKLLTSINTNNNINLKEKMIQGFDSCSPSTFFILINKKYYFNPYNKNHLSIKSFDGEENVKIYIKKYKYTPNNFAKFRIKNLILNIDELLRTKNSTLLKEAINLVTKNQLKKSLYNYLIQLREEEKQNFYSVMKEKDLDVLNSYINIYKGSQYLPKVKDKIAFIEKENLIKKFRLEKTPQSYYQSYKLSKDKDDIRDMLKYFDDLNKLLVFLEDKNEIIQEELIKQKLVKFYREKNDIKSLIKAYDISKDKNDLTSVYTKITNSTEEVVLEDSLINIFYEGYVSNFENAIKFIAIINKLRLIDKNKYFNKIIKLPDFKKDFIILNFLSSLEYKTLLKDLKPTIKFIATGDNSYLDLKYLDTHIKLTIKNKCSYSHQTSKEKTLGFMEVFLGASMKYNSKTVFYNVYSCKIEDKEIQNINSIYKEIYGFIEHNNYNWTKSLYSHKEYNTDINATNKSKCYSINNNNLRSLCLGSMDKNSCYSIKSDDYLNLCLGFSNKNSCFSIKNEDIRNLCLGTREKSLCYSIKNSDKRNLCLGRFDKNICYSIKNQNLLNLCLSMH
jgi:hypothetical protein